MAVVLALGACSTLHPHAPPPTRPARAIPATPSSGVSKTKPENYEQDRSRIKRTLAKSENDSLAPSEVGYYMDVLLGRFRQIAGSNVAVRRRSDGIVLDLSVRGGFAAGNRIEPILREALAPLANTILEYRKTLVSVGVRADSGDSPQLTEQRASAVARYFVDRGIAGKRVLASSSGGSKGAHVPADKVVTTAPAHVELLIEPIVRAAGDKP
jgi:outer membrane protein OmpA-like peptidoglycan-associated protein